MKMKVTNAKNVIDFLIKLGGRSATIHQLLQALGAVYRNQERWIVDRESRALLLFAKSQGVTERGFLREIRLRFGEAAHNAYPLLSNDALEDLEEKRCVKLREDFLSAS